MNRREMLGTATALVAGAVMPTLPEVPCDCDEPIAPDSLKVTVFGGCPCCELINDDFSSIDGAIWTEVSGDWNVTATEAG